MVLTISVLLVVAGLAVAVGAAVTGGMRPSLLSSEIITNQSITISGATNNTAILLTNTEVTGINQLTNGSLIFNSGNYTLTSGQDASYITPVIRGTNFTLDSTAFNVSYTALQKTRASLVLTNATVGLGQMQLPSIGTVAGAAAILAIIFGTIAGVMVGRRNGSSE